MLNKADTDDDDEMPEDAVGARPYYPTGTGSASSSGSSRNAGTSPTTRAILIEINTEIDRRGTGGPGARLWSIQAPVTRLNWAQVGRWDNELKRTGADRCGVGELNGADRRYPRSLKGFEKTCNTNFTFQQLSFTDRWSATLHQPRGPLQLGATQEGLTRMIVVLVGKATYAGGRLLPRAAVHLYSPDTPLSDIKAAGRTQILLLVLEQKMEFGEETTCDPPAGLRSQILSGTGRPGDKHDVLQIVHITLDDCGRCSLRPPGSRVQPVVIDNTRTAACTWEPTAGTILVTLTSSTMKALRQRPAAWPTLTTAWQDWVGGGSGLLPRPHLRLRLSEELMADREVIVRRLTPNPGAGNRNLADLLQGLDTAPSTGPGQRGRGGRPSTRTAQAGAAPLQTGSAAPGGRGRSAHGGGPRGEPAPPGANAARGRSSGSTEECGDDRPTGSGPQYRANRTVTTMAVSCTPVPTSRTPSYSHLPQGRWWRCETVPKTAAMIHPGAHRNSGGLTPANRQR